MTKIAASWNTGEERSNRYKFERNCFRVGSHCLKPIGMALWKYIPSSFWWNNCEALSQITSYIHGPHFSLSESIRCLELTSLLDVSVMLVNCIVCCCNIRLKTSGTYTIWNIHLKASHWRDIRKTLEHTINLLFSISRLPL